MRVRILVEAAAVIDAAASFYNDQSPGLGAEFAIEVRSGLARILKHPKAWALMGRRVRRYRLNRFPYGLVYAPLDTEILIIAVMHLHRKPDYWKERLPSV